MHSLDPWPDLVPPKLLDCGSQFLAGCRSEVVLNFLLHGLLHWVAHNMVLGFIQVSHQEEEREKGRTGKRERRKAGRPATIFYNLILFK